MSRRSDEIELLNASLIKLFNADEDLQDAEEFADGDTDLQPLQRRVFDMAENAFDAGASYGLIGRVIDMETKKVKSKLQNRRSTRRKAEE